MNITISNTIKEKYPDMQLACLTYDCKVGTYHAGTWGEIEDRVIPELLKTMEIMNLTEIENIHYARLGYRALGKDPTRYRISSEAMYRRIKQGKGLYQINTVVDVNNLVSLETGFSVGSYDLEHVQGDVVFKLGEEGDSYKGIGKDDINIEDMPTLSDELGAFGSPTSDSRRAMIGKTASKVLTVIFVFTPNYDMDKLLKEVKITFEKYANAKNVETFCIK